MFIRNKIFLFFESISAYHWNKIRKLQLRHCPTAPLRHCPTAPLPHCPTAPLPQCVNDRCLKGHLECHSNVAVNRVTPVASSDAIKQQPNRNKPMKIM